MRLALGCMRLSTDGVLDDDGAIEVIVAAIASGVDVLDTARSYGPARDGVVTLGHAERLVARALAQSGRTEAVRVVTKCGMRREGEAWVPDGRASAILEDAAASAEALGRPPDVLLLHAPDPRTPLATSLRALMRAKEEGLARAIGLSNVGRKEIVAAEAPLSVVEVALGAFDDGPTRGGVVEACAARGIEVFAHAPFGGPKRASRLARDGVLAAQASRLGTTAHVLFLAYLCSLHPSIVPVVGARRVATARALAEAAALTLDDEARTALAERFPTLAPRAPLPLAGADTVAGPEVVMIMGLPGAGKSELAEEYVARGHLRLNRDTLGGTLKGIVKRLDDALAAGARGVVLDNTYVTRALRSDVVRAASRHRARVRCIFVDTPPDEARINVVGRILARHGGLLPPDALKALSKTDPTALAPSAVNRMLRDLEPPEADEGFASIEVRPFERRHREGGAVGLAVPLEAIARVEGDRLVARGPATWPAPPAARVLVFGWWPVPRDEEARVVAEASRFVAARFGEDAAVTICTHPAGPPICWCRPPLPGAWLAFAHRHAVDPRRSTLIATSPAHRTMARTLGLRVEEG